MIIFSVLHQAYSAVRMVGSYIWKNPLRSYLIVSSIVSISKTTHMAATFISSLPRSNCNVLGFSCQSYLHNDSYIEYRGMQAQLATLVNCKPKPDGQSRGKICTFNSTRFFMKNLPPPSEGTKTLTNKLKYHNDIFLGERNRRFVRDNMGILVPNGMFVCAERSTKSAGDRYECHLSTEEVAGFKTAADLCAQKGPFDHCIYDRDKVIAKIGESGLIQLVAANTFIKDLHSKNWGHTGKKFVIVDLDQSPKTFEDYIVFVERKLNPGKDRHLGIPLTLLNLKQLKAFYEGMLLKPLIPFHDSIDITAELYESLLNTYISACELAIDRLGKENLENQPSYKCNSAFSAAISEAATNHKKNTGPRP